MDILKPFRMQLLRGWFGAAGDNSNDEVVLMSQAPDGEEPDCPKFRFRITDGFINGEVFQPGSIGWISFDYKPRGRSEIEMGGFKLELDERFRIVPGKFSKLAGYWKLFAKGPNGNDDKDMICVGTVAHDEALAVFGPDGVLKATGKNGETMVPVLPPPAPAPPPSFLRSPGNRYDMEMQTDGCVTCYDEAGGHVPMWQIRYVDGSWQFVSLNAPVIL